MDNQMIKLKMNQLELELAFTFWFMLFKYMKEVFRWRTSFFIS
jgi:hypothetical protein